MSQGGSSRGADIRWLLSVRPFRLFWTAVAGSSFGGQFFTVALPWLVLQLSQSDVALGSVLMCASLPRAGLMLAGGALSDRIPPARVLLLANVARAVLVGAMAALVALGLAQLWQLYVLALLFGCVDALSGPASTAIVPAIAGYGRLAAANSVIQSTAQVGAMVAPALAGALIAARGVGASLTVSAAASAFAASAYALLTRASDGAGGGAASAAAVPEPDAAAPAGTMAVLRIALGDPALRTYLVLVAAISLATSGPLAVGLPRLAQARFGGSVGFGLMLSAAGGGTLIGALFGGSRVRHRGLLVLVVNTLLGGLLIVLPHAPTIGAASLVIAIMSCASTFVNLVVTATLQAGVNRAILGRLLAIVMLASVGLSPISYILAGLASAVDPLLLFRAAGTLVILATIHAALNPALRRVD
jgi:MFS family permease